MQTEKKDTEKKTPLFRVVFQGVAEVYNDVPAMLP
jgi:hypothetical protein